MKNIFLLPLDRSVIKFSPKALEHSSKYLEDEESAKSVKEYAGQLIGRAYFSEESEVFAEDVAVTAILTSLMDETWFTRVNQEEYFRRFVRRNLHWNLQWRPTSVSWSITANKF